MTHFSGKDPFVNMDDIFNQLMANRTTPCSDNQSNKFSNVNT